VIAMDVDVDSKFSIMEDLLRRHVQTAYDETGMCGGGGMLEPAQVADDESDQGCQSPIFLSRARELKQRLFQSSFSQAAYWRNAT
jgi:hypothetical protein